MPIHELCFRNELFQLPLMSVVFSATKVLYNISGLGGLAIFKCPAHFPSTCPRLFIDGHNVPFYCIKGKCHDRRHLLFVVLSSQKFFVSCKQIQNKAYVYVHYFSVSFFSSSGKRQSHHLGGCQAMGINSSFIFAF